MARPPFDWGDNEGSISYRTCEWFLKSGALTATREGQQIW